ncbi:hypothetical protein ACWD4G_10240 [Streptomyces sp. NPDC002643]
MNAELPPAAPDVVAAAVESLTSRLRKKLDAAIESYAALPVTADAGALRIRCGEDAEVTLTPGASGALTDPEQVLCSCLLAPRCLHRAAVLGVCPVADADDLADMPAETTAASGAGAGAHGEAGVSASGGTPARPADSVEPSATTVAPAATTPAAPASARTAAPTAPTPTGSNAADADRTPADPNSAGRAPTDANPAGRTPAAPTSAQVSAARALWAAAAAVLSAGVPAAGAVPQAELLRAAHTARLAGLHRAEAAALRVVRGLRGARARHDGHRLADLVANVRELLLTAGLLMVADPDQALIGTARRAYRPGGGLRVHGVCREPVIAATGYGGVVTHLVSDDGRWFSIADVKPGGPARARGAATATVALGSGSLNHSQLSRGGLLITGATLSPDGRLGSGKGVRATPVAGLPWTSEPGASAGAGTGTGTRAGAGANAGTSTSTGTGTGAGTRAGSDASAGSGTGSGTSTGAGSGTGVGPGSGPLAALFARPLAEAVAERLAGAPGADPERAEQAARELIGCDLVLVGAAGDQLLARELAPGRPVEEGPLIRLTPANGHPDLAHTANFHRLASRPGLRLRVIGRLDPDRAATLRPLAVGPVPGIEATLRLPSDWQGRADLGYDRLEGVHLPPADSLPPVEGLAALVPDPLAEAPLWRLRRLVEVAVSGGRRAVAEPARDGDRAGAGAALRRSGFRAAADLAIALTSEADRRTRDVFGRTEEADPDGYARAWLAAAAYLSTTEQALVRATWQPAPNPAPAPASAPAPAAMTSTPSTT